MWQHTAFFPSYFFYFPSSLLFNYFTSPNTFNISTKTIHISYFILIQSTLLSTGFTWIMESLLQASKAWMVELLNICLIRTNPCFSHAFCTFSVTLKLPSSSKLNVTSSTSCVYGETITQWDKRHFVKDWNKYVNFSRFLKTCHFLDIL